MAGSSGGTNFDSGLTRPQRKVAQKTGSLIEQNLGQPMEQFPGEMIAALIPGMLQALSMISPTQMGQFDPQSAAAIEQGLSGQPSYDLSPQATENYFQRGVMAPMLRSYEQDIAPRIREGFAAKGASWSSRRGDATRKALEGLQTGALSELSRAVFSNQGLEAQLAESAANRQLGTVPLAEAFGMRDVSRGGALTSAFAPFQAFEQAKASADYNEWMRTRPENSPWLQAALAFTGQPHLIATQSPDLQAGFWNALMLQSAGDLSGMLGSLAGGGGSQGGSGLSRLLGGAT